MKNYILPLAFLALIACSEEQIAPEPFVGSWSLQASEIQVAFDVVKDGAALNYYNKRVTHPAIPESEQTNNNMIAYERFADGTGYGRIEITSRGTFYYKVSLIYNRFTEEGMMVYDVQVDIAGQDFFVLQDQLFTRK